MGNIQIKRVYDMPEYQDGKRVLVDRLWPRGLAKEKAHVDEWLKEIAPSKDLCKWFNHIPERFAEFRQRYVNELQENPAAGQQLEQLHQWMNEGIITLLYSAKDSEHNNAIVLRDFLIDTWEQDKT